MRTGQEGQSTVELALALPLVMMIVAAVVQVGIVVSDQARLWHAAREAARVGIVDPDLQKVKDAVRQTGLDDVGVTVEPLPEHRVQGEPLSVSLVYRPEGKVPLLGALFDRVELHAGATMRIERP